MPKKKSNKANRRGVKDLLRASSKKTEAKLQRTSKGRRDSLAPFLKARERSR